MNISASAGELNGEIILKWNTVKKASGYIVELKINKENSLWEQIEYANKPKCIISGLSKSIVYLLRISAINSSDGVCFSDTIKIEL